MTTSFKTNVCTFPSLIGSKNLRPVVEDYPAGYPQLAAYINYDINTKLFRRFSSLRTRLLLNHQTSLTSLEKRLLELDRHDE